MSEYLFRGRRLKDKQWVYGYLCTSTNYIGDTERRLSIQENGYFRQVDPATVGQYIGLKDRHEFDIYDGDRLNGNWLGDNRKGTVVFIDEIASYGILFDGRTTPCAVLNKMDWFSKNSETVCEIIGNIHEVTP